MKPLIALGMVIVGGIVVWNANQTPQVYEKPAETTIIEQPQWMQDEDAVAAAQAVIKKKELEAKAAELKSVIKEKQTELDSINKELGVY